MLHFPLNITNFSVSDTMFITFFYIFQISIHSVMKIHEYQESNTYQSVSSAMISKCPTHINQYSVIISKSPTVSSPSRHFLLAYGSKTQVLMLCQCLGDFAAWCVLNQSLKTLVRLMPMRPLLIEGLPQSRRIPQVVWPSEGLCTTRWDLCL